KVRRPGFVLAVLLGLAASPAGATGWEDRYRLARRGLVAFAARAPNRLLLTTNESGTYQLESRDLSTGEKHTLTRGAAGRTSGAISPDGKFVYYVEDAGGNETGRWVRVPFEGGDARPTGGGPAGSSAGIAFDPAGRFVVAASSGPDGFRFERREDGAKPVELYRSNNEAYGPALSADGRYLSLVETERKNDRHWATLVLDARSGRRIAELWDGEGNSVTAGRWSPVPGDERLLVQSDRSGFLRPGSYDASTGARTELGSSLSGEVTAEDWSPDAGRVLLKRHEGGRDRLFLFTIASKALEAISVGDGSIGECALRPGGKVWATFQSAAVTPRLLEIDPASGARKTVLASEDAPPGTPLSPVEFRGAGEDPVPALLGVPAHPNGAAIVWLHGGPHSETADAFSPTIQAYLDEGFAVLAPNYHGSSGLGRAWANSVVGDPMTRELDDVGAARRYLVENRLARPDAVFVGGWSYGGYLTLCALGRQPGLWAGGIAGAPIADFTVQYEDARAALRGWTVMLFGGTPTKKPALYRERSPLARAQDIRAPLLIFAGRNDRRAPPRQVELFLEALDAMKKEVTVRWFDAGHGSLSAEEQIAETRETIAFLRRVAATTGKNARIGKEESVLSGSFVVRFSQ
ncbi:MAG TPA: alpha/beta fold hydrolase, partial [Thermoanaerobaculia bacterium]|nr:alpha/beta fold hydrolase [Thermoanaerobaculia bacterium]